MVELLNPNVAWPVQTSVSVCKSDYLKTVSWMNFHQEGGGEYKHLTPFFLHSGHALQKKSV